MNKVKFIKKYNEEGLIFKGTKAHLINFAKKWILSKKRVGMIILIIMITGKR